MNLGYFIVIRRSPSTAHHLTVHSLRGGLAEGNRIAVCRWFNGIWGVHKLLKQFSTLHRSKMENFCKNNF